MDVSQSSQGDVVDPSSLPPVLMSIGVRGHALIAKAFRKRLNRYVEAITLNGQGMEYANNIEAGVLGRIVSFPDHYQEHMPTFRELSDTEILEQSRQAEDLLGLCSVNPYHYFDRNLRRNGNWGEVIRWHLLNLTFVKKVLVGREYFFVRGENVTHIGCLIQQAASSLGHHYIRASNARLPNRLEFGSRTLGHLCGIYPGYERIRSGVTDPYIEQSLEEADEWLSQFRRNPDMPSWAHKNSRLQMNIGNRLRQYCKLGFQRLMRPTRQSREVRKFDREAKLTRVPGAVFFKQMLLPDIRRLIHKRRSIFRRTISTEGDFVYLPLQYSPEISTLVYGYRYEDQMNLVRTLCAYLPTGCRLLVKDHMSMLGRRPYSFYKTLDSFYNVEVVPPTVNTFDLLKKCRAVATNTGTPGWEGFVMGKPVIVFGDVFYRYFPNVLGLEFTRDMGQSIRSYLEEFQKDEEVIRNCVASYFAATYKSTMVDIGEDTPSEEAVEKSEKFADACKWAVEYLEDEVNFQWDR